VVESCRRFRSHASELRDQPFVGARRAGPNIVFETKLNSIDGTPSECRRATLHALEARTRRSRADGDDNGDCDPLETRPARSSHMHILLRAICVGGGMPRSSPHFWDTRTTDVESMKESSAGKFQFRIGI
jgi:hypothetical protein